MENLPQNEVGQNPVVITEDEYIIARQLFISFLSDPWDKLYHRDKPSHAQKVDENEFAFYTSSE